MNVLARTRPVGPGVIVLSLVLSVWLATLQGAFPSDDSAIHLRFAWNLAEHGELTFNPGEKSFSTTSPLWNAVVGLGARVLGTGKDRLLRLSQALAAVWLVLAAGGLLWLARSLYGRWLPVVVVLFALDPYVTATVHDAMEQPLFVALGALGLILVLRGERGSTRSLLAAGAVFAVQYAARPEALAFAAAAGLYLLLRRGLRSCLVLAAAVVVALVPVAWVLQRELGSVVPLSLLMKTHDSHGWLPLTATGSSRRVVQLLAQVYGLPLLGLAGLLAFGVRDGRREFLGRSALPLLVVLLLTVAYVGFLKEKAVASRYLVNFMPFGWVVAGGLLARVRPPRLALLAGGGLAVYLVALNLVAAPRRVERGLALEPERIEIGNWLRQATPRDSTVWCFDIGWVGFTSGRTIYDFNLVDAPAYGTSLGLRKRRGELDLARAIVDNHIDYLVWGPTDLPDLALERVYTARREKHGGHRSVYRVLHEASAVP